MFDTISWLLWYNNIFVVVELQNDNLKTVSVCFDLPLKILPDINASIHVFEFFHNFWSNIGYYGIFIKS